MRWRSTALVVCPPARWPGWSGPTSWGTRGSPGAAWVGLRRRKWPVPTPPATRATAGAERDAHDTGRPADGRLSTSTDRGPAQPRPTTASKSGSIVGGRDRRRRSRSSRVAPGRPPAFFSTGAQPAEALPASTVAYVSVDLDPSGGQKIEAHADAAQVPGVRGRGRPRHRRRRPRADLRRGHLQRRVRGPRLRRRRRAVARRPARRWPWSTSATTSRPRSWSCRSPTVARRGRLPTLVDGVRGQRRGAAGERRLGRRRRLGVVAETQEIASRSSDAADEAHARRRRRLPAVDRRGSATPASCRCTSRPGAGQVSSTSRRHRRHGD